METIDDSTSIRSSLLATAACGGCL